MAERTMGASGNSLTSLLICGGGAGLSEGIMFKKICLKCGKIIAQGEACCSIKIKRETTRVYDKKRRDKRSDKFYHSVEWARTRAKVLSDYKGIDVWAYYNGGDKVATTIHHIEEVKENWDKRLSLDNLFPCSSETHKKIHDMYRKDKAGTQKELQELLKRWKKEYPRAEKV